MKVTVAEVREMYFSFADVFQFMSAMDNKVFELTYQDYLTMPALTMELYGVYKNEKQKLINEKVKASQ